MFNKLTIYGVIALAFVTLFVLWRSAVTENKKNCELLSVAQQNILALKQNNDNLLEYISSKESEIENIRDKYKDKANNIPKDDCGDVYPSEKLLKFLKEK